ncbi:holo-ACP synthase [Clostridium botulinum]|uniref:Holo-[acyl-carrier-protein] synthase n=1 Tax=Clostridium botulinum (strain Hall / ATCC 3502 / NCTC 13319 / Type A) TaxID=441771 RepID=A5I7C5_CLOBH|nr:holo-ACP synthase [Clostridium botulinum]EPS50536.1 4'-phosphopantetheinyl transferase [Clostridium botulinum CFSAN002367]ABS33683.1 holo-(acyl-carrier-protein) synthase [Clostridium botulinum A str. ATCC 19397]ABS39111.1 holo-(acyl-carrier-protein) synthase [Clostridium botulinum A str. Hall]AWB19205.1 holo-ACP synthase [Clostridium botulinum]AWB32017.1 holo-ACP synthase [Clostridium botulinum]
MIYGIGTDITEIRRIEKAITRNKNFINKLFTKNEMDLWEKKNFKLEFIAGRFAAKEAVSKALGTGIRDFNFKDIEIINNELGKPQVILKPKAEDIIRKISQSYKIHLSISHEKEYAIAYALLEVFI